jgi:hypothetical protein
VHIMLALVVIKNIPKALELQRNNSVMHLCGNTENASYWFGKVFPAFRYYMTVFWLAETNPEEGHLVSFGLGLALAVGVFRLEKE